MENKAYMAYNKYELKIKALDDIYNERYATKEQTPEELIKLNEWHERETSKARMELIKELDKIFKAR